jgi:hypothetical protein
MADANGGPDGAESTLDLKVTARIGRGDTVGPGVEDVQDFAVAEPARFIGMSDAVDARTPAAMGGLRERD